MCTIFSRDGKLGDMKSLSSGATIITLGGVSPWGIRVGSGIFGVATCTSYTHYNINYISG